MSKKTKALVIVVCLSACGWLVFDKFSTSDDVPSSSVRLMSEEVTVDSLSERITLAPSNLDSVAIIALGESTHASKELILWRYYFTKHLIEEKGFNLIGLEVTYSEAETLNSFVLGQSQGDARTILKNTSYRLLQNDQMMLFLEWLKDHNLQSKEKVAIFGIDVPFSTSLPRNVMAYLSGTDPKMSIVADSIFRVISNAGIIKHGPRNTLLLTDTSITAKVGFLKDLVMRSRLTLIGKSSIAEYYSCIHNLNLIGLAAGRIESYKEGSTTFSNYRDSSMYENVKWLLSLDHLRESRMVIWAHNEHIERVSFGDKKSLGYFLNSWLKEKFCSIGSDFGYGHYAYITQTRIGIAKAAMLQNAFSEYHETLELPIYFFNFGALTRRKHGGVRTRIHSIPANAMSPIYDVVFIDRAFDGFVYIPKSSAPSFF